MEISVTTPGLLFPAISLLFLSYTNRFLHLAALIRQLHESWLREKSPHLRHQIDNLRIRLLLIRWMQLLGVSSLFCCVLSIVTVLFGYQLMGGILFLVALVLMGFSLLTLFIEIAKSGGALRILLEEVGGKD
ncbi:MAG: DUF2721 domain-containing protein [Verrucomicrobiota bacterium]